ncbi:MAG: outer membrane beta-barrel protein [Flavobacteriales bacterium]
MKKSITFLALFYSFVTIAQTNVKDLKSNITLSGSIDAYFRTNLNANSNAAPGSSFANLPGFSLGMANIIAQYEGKKVGFVADLVYGPRGTDAIFASPMYSATGDIINQLYIYWNVSKTLKLTFGNFNTFLGYEVISPTGNFNYSTSYLFSYGPFSHTGLKADIALSDKVSLMLAVMNPTDATEFNPTDKYAFGAQLGFADQFLNFLTDDGAYEIDYTGGFNLTKSFFLGINAAVYDSGDSNNSGFAGVALYPQLKTSEQVTIGLRGEYFSQTGNFDAIGTGMKSNVFATTLSANIKIGDLTIIPELRLDSSSDDSSYFLDKNSLAQKSLSSFLLATVYKF